MGLSSQVPDLFWLCPVWEYQPQLPRATLSICEKTKRPTVPSLCGCALGKENGCLGETQLWLTTASFWNLVLFLLLFSKCI